MLEEPPENLPTDSDEAQSDPARIASAALFLTAVKLRSLDTPWMSGTGLPALPMPSRPRARQRRRRSSCGRRIRDCGLRIRRGCPTRAWNPAERKTRVGIRLGRIARDLIETVILALLIFVGVRAMVQNFRVEGSSMEGTLHDGQYILVNKAVYFKVDLGFLDFLPFYDAGE